MTRPWKLPGNTVRFCGIVIACVCAMPIHAQEPRLGPLGRPQSPVQGDLLQRLENLEKKNDELTRKLRDIELRDPKEGETSIALPSEKNVTKGDEKKADTKKEAAAEKTYVVGENVKLEGVWRNGLWFETVDKAFKFSVGGTVQFDMGWFSAGQNIVNSIGTMSNYTDPGLALSDGMDIRRARLRFTGLAYETIEFNAQYDFAQSIDLRRRTVGVTTPTAATVYDLNPAEGTQFNEVYIGITKIPLLGTLRFGHHRESLNFVTATADRNQVWMERGLLFDAFNGDFNFANGVTMDRTYFNERAYTLLGFFENNSRGFATVGDGNYAYDGRVTALPIYDEEKELWVHVGFDYSYRNLTQNQLRLRARPLVRIGNGFQVPNILDTGIMFSPDAQQIANIEFASACGPLTFSAEATRSWVTNVYTGGLPLANGTLPKGVTARGTYVSQGAYAELLCFLTPDHRRYRKDRPGHDRIVPRENFFIVDGEDGPIWNRGAWEVGVRYDYLDITDAGINGGVGNSITLALNWYLNPNTRFQWNYFIMNRDFTPTDTGARVAGNLQGLGVRVNMDF